MTESERKQAENMANLLNCTIEQAFEIMQEDKEIDKMTPKQAESDLTAEQKEASHKARRGAKAPTAYKFTPRQRKPNDTKRMLINKLAECLAEYSPKVTNIERFIEFEVDGVAYKVALSAPRTKKGE